MYGTCRLLADFESAPGWDIEHDRFELMTEVDVGKILYTLLGSIRSGSSDGLITLWVSRIMNSISRQGRTIKKSSILLLSPNPLHLPLIVKRNLPQLSYQISGDW